MTSEMLSSQQKLFQFRVFMNLTLEEKESITKALGQIKWYKCGYGHIYCVGECGKPVGGYSCPKCQTVLIEIQE